MNALNIATLNINGINKDTKQVKLVSYFISIHTLPLYQKFKKPKDLLKF